MVAPLRGFMEDLVTVVITKVFNMLSFCLERSVKCQATLETKYNRPFTFSLCLIDPGAYELSRVNLPYFHIRSGKKNTFTRPSVYSTVPPGEPTRIRSLLAYELVNGCGTHEKIFVVILSF